MQRCQPILFAPIAILGLLAATPAQAQCSLELHGGGGFATAFAPGLPIVNSIEAALPWDPDGAGPATPWLVVGGTFISIGNLATEGLAGWDPATRTWHSIGNGVAGNVLSLAIAANGDLVVGGQFTSVGGTAARNIARWNGSTWSALGPGLPQPVYALTAQPNGFLAAASLGPQQLIGAIDRWNGSTWTALPPWLGPTGTSTRVDAVATLANGDLVASIASSVPSGFTYGIGRWTGSAWAIFATMNYAAWSMAVLPNGDLVAAGGFTTMQGNQANRIARWNGTTWSPLATGLDDNQPTPLSGWGPRSVIATANGDVITAGVFLTAGGLLTNRIARWNGSAWSALADGSGFAPRTVTELPNGDIVAGSLAGAVAAFDTNLTRFDGIAWGPVADGPDQPVLAATTVTNGDLVLGGEFRAIGGKAIRYLAQRSGGTFQALGTGVDGPVRALAATRTGSMIAAGAFTHAGGNPTGGIASWNGTAWSAIDAGWSGATFHRLLALRGGSVAAFVTGSWQGIVDSYVATWNGSTWTLLGRFGGTLFAENVRDLCELDNGDLVVGGDFTTVDSVALPYLARWDGTAWSGLACPLTAVRTVDLLPTGELVVGGTRSGPTTHGELMRYNGTAWSTHGPVLSDAPVDAAVLPNGDLAFAGPGLLAHSDPYTVRRTDGTVATDLLGPMDGPITALHVEANGSVAAFGPFTKIGTTLTGHYAELTPTCPAAAVSYGSGCSGSYGLVTLTADALPWLGNSFRATARGFGATSMVVRKVGLTQIAVPLNSIFVQSPSDCMLLATGDILFDFLLPTNGELRFAIPVPATPSLVGLSAFAQVADVEFNQQPAIALIAESNGLQLVLGAF